jgi:hypothetical protein
MKMKTRKSQVTWFVVIAIIIVATLMITLFILNKPVAKILPEENPRDYIKQCVEYSLEKNEKILIDNNLYRNRTNNFILYRNIVVPYLCKSSLFYTPCINQEPLLIEHVRKEIANLTEAEIKTCFVGLVNAFKSKGYDVKEGDLEITTDLKRGFIELQMNKDITTTKSGETKQYKDFIANIQSPMYRLVDTVRNIINYESTLCEFDEVKWALNYRDLKITSFVASEGTKVYTLEDKESGKEINFAVKSCVMPAGL